MCCLGPWAPIPLPGKENNEPEVKNIGIFKCICENNIKSLLSYI